MNLGTELSVDSCGFYRVDDCSIGGVCPGVTVGPSGPGACFTKVKCGVVL